MHILIIEDETRLAATLADLLDSSGYETSLAHNGLDGLALAESGGYDAILLDVMLPGLDGFELLTLLRNARITTPVLMLTARSDLSDRVRGLDAGADYYLTKPFENEELLACLRTILRRTGEAPAETLTFGDLSLTLSASRLSCGSHDTALSAKELELMRLLMQNKGQLLSKETLLSKVWGYDCDVNANSVEAYLSFLRRKLALLGSSVRIRVVRNLGYRLEEENQMEGES